MNKEERLEREETLAYRQGLPLSIKAAMTRTRIRSFINYYGEDGAYISFSGGKDSTVLLDLVRQDFPNVPVVYIDTWMEYPESRQFVKDLGISNLTVLKPDKTMPQIIKECGWCVPSKDVAECIYYARQGSDWALKKLDGLDKNGQYSEYRQRYIKWKFLLDAPFKISHLCCIEMKEKVVAKYEEETGRHPILALMADESARRKEAYLRTGCNAFDDVSRPMSKPMGFWKTQDVLHYIKEHNLTISPVYGDIVSLDVAAGAPTIFDLMGDYSCCDLCTTGEQRTGCMFCPVGCHLDGFRKFNAVKERYPAVYDYFCGLGLQEVIDYLRAHLSA
jgi:3'-phosphoadenosine 5'-phosphosulfate sulfotransferase (PAPS reductase)/FAD synthetase